MQKRLCKTTGIFVRIKNVFFHLIKNVFLIFLFPYIYTHYSKGFKVLLIYIYTYIYIIYTYIHIYIYICIYTYIHKYIYEKSKCSPCSANNRTLCCKQVISSTFTSQQTNKSYTIFHKVNCSSADVIYLMECTLCKSNTQGNQKLALILD